MKIAGALGLALLAGAVPVTFASGYLLLLVVLSGRTTPPTDGRRFRFQIVVPAHDEELGIANTVNSLRALDYPGDAFSVLVVADNCSDATAERARAAGAEVLQRKDNERRGKGHALNYAFERLRDDTDAVVVVDADTLVSPNLLKAFAARLALGAHAVQADSAVSNPGESWRTRLMAIALGSFHVVRSRGRERLGLSVGLRGNGMCFTREVLARVPHEAYSIVEDVEYGIRLGEAGFRVHYSDEAHVYGEMVSSSAAARSQRARWEGGRRALKRAHGWRLIRKGISQQNAVLFDLGLDLLVPALSGLAASALAGSAASTAAAVLIGGPARLAMLGFGGSLAGLGVYVLRGWSLSGTGLRGLLDLGFSPVYAAWKLSVRKRRETSADAAWVRTSREAER
jgi:1,2-diacylglycerol 3-beta-glucosyltransferase